VVDCRNKQLQLVVIAKNGQLNLGKQKQGAKMRRIIVLVWAMMLGIVFAAGTAYAGEKFAYVDLAKIFSGYNKAKDYEKVLSDKQSAYENERGKMVSEIKQFQDKMNLLNDKEKETKRVELENKMKNAQELDRQKQGELRKEQDEKTKELLKDINGVIKQYAEKERYTMVLDSNALVYKDKNLDITDKVIGLLTTETKKSDK
jgi:outer membrane protein